MDKDDVLELLKEFKKVGNSEIKKLWKKDEEIDRETLLNFLEEFVSRFKEKIEEMDRLEKEE